VVPEKFFAATVLHGGAGHAHLPACSRRPRPRSGALSGFRMHTTPGWPSRNGIARAHATPHPSPSGSSLLRPGGASAGEAARTLVDCTPPNFPACENTVSRRDDGDRFCACPAWMAGQATTHAISSAQDCWCQHRDVMIRTNF